MVLYLILFKLAVDICLANRKSNRHFGFSQRHYGTNVFIRLSNGADANVILDNGMYMSTIRLNSPQAFKFCYTCDLNRVTTLLIVQDNYWRHTTDMFGIAYNWILQIDWLIFSFPFEMLRYFYLLIIKHRGRLYLCI